MNLKLLKSTFDKVFSQDFFESLWTTFLKKSEESFYLQIIEKLLKAYFDIGIDNAHIL